MAVAATRTDVVDGYAWAYGTTCVPYLAVAPAAVALLGLSQSSTTRRATGSGDW